MLKVEVPPKAVWARMILSEFSRIMDHCVCNGTTLVDAGGLTSFWYLFQPREEIYGLLESVCGARLTVSACRIGGLIQELPPDFEARCRRLLEMIPQYVERRRDAGQQEPDLDRPLGGRRRHLRRGRGELGLDRPLPAGERRRLRRAPGAPLRPL